MSLTFFYRSLIERGTELDLATPVKMGSASSPMALSVEELVATGRALAFDPEAIRILAMLHEPA
jgi:hypothetical protein